jgi:trk system potassium uptake protein TrkA
MRIVIAGGGQSAALVAARLSREGNQLVIVEENPERCLQLEESLDAKIVRGNATSISALREAGIGDAEMLIALTSVDQINVLVCLIAHVESNVRVKVARLRTHEVEHWRRICREAGLNIDLIIHPETDIADRILRVVYVPGVTDILDFAEGKVKLFAMNIDRDNWVAGKTVEDLDRAGPPPNSLMAMIFRGQQVIIPHGAQVLLPDDQVYIVTTAEELEANFRFMGLQSQKSLDRVFILGGKQVVFEWPSCLNPWV